MIIDELVSMIQAYQEDNPHIIITDEIIKELVEEYKEEIIKKIREMI